MHLALGTSMATIVFTSISSLRAHHQHGAVIWPIVRDIAPGIVVGTLLAAQVAARVPTKPLAIFFAVFIAYVAVQMILNIKPKPSRQLPGTAGMFGVGAVIGGISALVGHRRRLAVGAVHDLVQRQGPSGHRHLGGDRLSHRAGRHHRLHDFRLRRHQPAGGQLRLHLFAGAGGHRGRLDAGGAVRRQARP